MPTYAELKEKGYFQYLVLLRKGKYEDSSFAALEFYLLSDVVKTPTEIADIFKEAFRDYANCVNENDNVVRTVSQQFENLFELDIHETIEVDCFSKYGIECRPHYSIPIRSVVHLDGMDLYCEEPCETWLFTKGRNADGSVTAEVFDSFDTSNPKG